PPSSYMRKSRLKNRRYFANSYLASSKTARSDTNTRQSAIPIVAPVDFVSTLSIKTMEVYITVFTEVYRTVFQTSIILPSPCIPKNTMQIIKLTINANSKIGRASCRENVEQHVPD